jgi:hypothetical protein
LSFVGDHDTFFEYLGRIRTNMVMGTNHYRWYFRLIKY